MLYAKVHFRISVIFCVEKAVPQYVQRWQVMDIWIRKSWKTLGNIHFLIWKIYFINCLAKSNLPISPPFSLYIPFEISEINDFIKFLRQNLTDRDKNIRVDNIKVELSNKNELRKIAGKIFVTFQGIIVYTASHINDYAICKSSCCSLPKKLTFFFNVSSKSKTSEYFLWNWRSNLQILFHSSLLKFDL
jgi:hypothetical protein